MSNSYRVRCNWCYVVLGTSPMWAHRTLTVEFDDKPEETVRDEYLYFCTDAHRAAYLYGF